jgi:DNA-binding MarR family transcriptional regulator
MKRQELISTIFDTMDTSKRSMHAYMQSAFSAYDITPSELQLLFTIYHGQPITAKELASRLHLTAGAVSQVIEALATRKLIQRETDPTDRRRQVLRLSAKGDGLVQKLDKHRRDVMHRVIKDLSDDELATWLKIQQKIMTEFQSVHTDTERKDA